MITRPSPLLPLIVAVSLTACGGWWDDDNSTAAGAGAASGSLTVATASPAAHNGTLDVSTAATSGNNARAADGFSSQAYCEIFFEDLRSSNGSRYALQVYFRQGDKQVLHSSLVSGSAATLWSVFDNAAGAPITGVTVNTTTRQLSFTNKVLKGSGTETATLNGSVSFPANAGTPACGG